MVRYSMVSLSIIDYGAGNLRSIGKALEKVGADILVSSNPVDIINKDGIVLPGVGAFGDAMAMLRERNLINIFKEIRDQDKPLLGVCLGLQILFSEGEEMGHFDGLNLIAGRVVKFPPDEKVPQIGWNTIDIQKSNHYLVQGIPNQSYMYFVHSFHPVLANPDNAIASTTYGKTTYASMVCNKEIVATQFHPEKSGKWGLKILENYVTHCHQ